MVKLYQNLHKQEGEFCIFCGAGLLEPALLNFYQISLCLVVISIALEISMAPHQRHIGREILTEACGNWSKDGSNQRFLVHRSGSEQN